MTAALITMVTSTSLHAQSPSMCFKSSHWEQLVMQQVQRVIGSDDPSTAKLQRNAGLPHMRTGNTIVVSDTAECASVARAFAQWKKSSAQAVPSPVVIIRAGDVGSPQEVRYIIFGGAGQAGEWDELDVFDGLLNYTGSMTF
ncbi:MAG: hypothetical protein ACR2M1_10355 [Gemmatimonadaceae bacterium]